MKNFVTLFLALGYTIGRAESKVAALLIVSGSLLTKNTR